MSPAFPALLFTRIQSLNERRSSLGCYPALSLVPRWVSKCKANVRLGRSDTGRNQSRKSASRRLSRPSGACKAHASLSPIIQTKYANAVFTSCHLREHQIGNRIVSKCTANNLVLNPDSAEAPPNTVPMSVPLSNENQAPSNNCAHAPSNSCAHAPSTSCTYATTTSCTYAPCRTEHSPHYRST